MAFAEKRAWIMLVVSAVAYAAYAVVILRRADGVPLADVAYQRPLVTAIVGSIVASIVANIVVGIFTPKGEEKPDQRDREIYRTTEYIGSAFVTIGGVGALILALLEVPYFWIANAVFLCFFLSSLLSSTAKIFAYRKGFGSW
jgi:hypothetical protein